MDYIIREIKKEEYDLLNDFLYNAIYILFSSYQSLLVYFQTKNGQPGGAGYLPYKHRTAGLPTSSHIIKCFAFLSLSF